MEDRLRHDGALLTMMANPRRNACLSLPRRSRRAGMPQRTRIQRLHGRGWSSAHGQPQRKLRLRAQVEYLPLDIARI